MQTTLDLLDAVKEKEGIDSDYALAPIIGTTRATVSAYRKGRVRMGDETAIRVAEILGLPPAYVFAIAHAERASEERSRVVWEELAKKLSHAAPIMAGVLLIPPMVAVFNSVQCILCKIVRILPERTRTPAILFSGII